MCGTSPPELSERIGTTWRILLAELNSTPALTDNPNRVYYIRQRPANYCPNSRADCFKRLQSHVKLNQLNYCLGKVKWTGRSRGQFLISRLPIERHWCRSGTANRVTHVGS